MTRSTTEQLNRACTCSGAETSCKCAEWCAGYERGPNDATTLDYYRANRDSRSVVGPGKVIVGRGRRERES